MTESLTPVEDLFARALEIPAGGRTAFLEEACRGDGVLRSQVEGLLRASAEAGEFLETGPVPGSHVGGYELVEEIGRGGFSTVWRARQTGALEREVAVKMIAPGMDSREVLRRFAAERQTLARMGHPGIARIFDAGADASGRPYFVMELVTGAPLTEYCRAHHLPRAERLRLFADVCAAVTHAHQRGVIHRDLKPSNILAGAGGVKVIDFGIARLLEPAAAEGMTVAGNLAGTPQWMPPEAFRGAPADVRADVFALGLLLCELVTDAPARDPAAWKAAGYTQWAALAEEPVTPLATRTDLDAIAARATTISPDRRYASVAELAEDLSSYFDHRPVRARAPSRAYLMGKFFRRHRVETLAAAIALAGVIAGSVAAWLKKAEADAARAAAEASARRAERTADMLERTIFAANPERGLPEDYSLGALLTQLSETLPPEAAADPLIEYRLRRSLGDVWLGRGNYPEAEKHHRRARDLARQHYGARSREMAYAQYALGNIALRTAQPLPGEPLLQEAAEIFREQEMPVMALRSEIQRALLLQDAGRSEEAESAARRAAEDAERGHPELLPRALWALGRVFSARRDWTELIPLARRRYEAQRSLTGDEAPETWEAESFLAEALAKSGTPNEARSILIAVLARQERHFGAEHPTTKATAAILQALP